MKKESQNKQILEHLERGLSIAPMEALRQFNCMRLGARIHNLREKHPIVTRMIRLPSSKRVARYRMIDIGSVVSYKDNLYRVTGMTALSPFFVDLKNDSGEKHFSVDIDFLS